MGAWHQDRLDNTVVRNITLTLSQETVCRQTDPSEHAVRQSPRGGRVGGGGVPTVGSRYVATPTEVVADFARAIVNCDLC
jgi:hypothetical protein